MREKISYSVYAIGLSYIIGFTGCWILPGLYSNLIKPCVILILFLKMIRERKCNIDKFFFILANFLMVVSVCEIINGIFSLKNLLSFYINVVYILLIAEGKYNSSERNFMYLSLKMASLVLGIILIFSNPLMSKISSSDIFLFKVAVNKNAIAYLIAPGLLICVKELMEGNLTNKRKKFFLIIEFVVLLYAAIYPMSRGGFLCAIAPLIILIIDRNIKYLMTGKSGKILGLLFLFLAVIVIIQFMPEQYFRRLFSLSNYSFKNSGNRVKYALQAVKLLEGSEVIGKGFGFYQHATGYSYGSHNCFVDFFVATGILGLFGFVAIFVFLVIKCRNAYSYAWITMSFCAAFFESQMSYQLWVPLAMAWIVWKSSMKVTKRKAGRSNRCLKYQL